MTPLLRPTIAISNALCDIENALGARGHVVASERVRQLREKFQEQSCRVMGRPRIVYGPMRDTCLDCQTIVDEHPNGRGRLTEGDSR